MSEEIKTSIHKCVGSVTAIQSGFSIIVHHLESDQNECKEVLEEVLKRIDTLKKDTELLNSQVLSRLKS